MAAGCASFSHWLSCAEGWGGQTLNAATLFLLQLPHDKDPAELAHPDLCWIAPEGGQKLRLIEFVLGMPSLCKRRKRVTEGGSSSRCPSDEHQCLEYLAQDFGRTSLKHAYFIVYPVLEPIIANHSQSMPVPGASVGRSGRNLVKPARLVLFCSALRPSRLCTPLNARSIFRA